MCINLSVTSRVAVRRLDGDGYVHHTIYSIAADNVTSFLRNVQLPGMTSQDQQPAHNRIARCFRTDAKQQTKEYKCNSRPDRADTTGSYIFSFTTTDQHIVSQLGTLRLDAIN